MLTRTVIAFAVACLFVGGQCPVRAQTQAEMNDRSCGEFKKADAELNRVYQQILTAHAGDAAFVKALREAQRAWVTFRDAHLKSIYPDPDPMAYGSVNPMCRCGVLEQLTAQRSKELQELWIQGTPEGDVCAGSSPVKRSNAAPLRKK